MAKKKKKRGKRDRTTSPIGGGAESKGKKRKREPTSSGSDDPSPTPSLAQLLKRHRGVAADAAPPPAWSAGVGVGGGRRAFLTPRDDPRAFDDCRRTSYSGFMYDAPESLPSSLHGDFDASLAGMERGGLFLYDAVQPGRRRLTRTSVTRTLVGDPGSTYKYLGLRLFSHPWVDVSEDGDAIDKAQGKGPEGSTLRKLGYTEQVASALMTMGLCNSRLIRRSRSMLEKHVSPRIPPPGLAGSTEFNLTLVNKMEPISDKRDLKREAAYGMGKISVGWHRDSGLKDFSSIAVYQILKEPSAANNDDPWGVALRAMDGGASGPLESVPPLLVPLPSGSLYYMLDDFNHNHEHAVIAAGSGSPRYSSTHRVAREGQGTWQYIRDKIRKLSSSAADFDWSKGVVNAELPVRKRKEKLVSRARAQQNLTIEIEFEWVRQWGVQGRKHAKLHPYWDRPIRFLCDSVIELERSTTKTLELLYSVSKDGPGKTHVTEDLFDVFIESFSERSKLSRSWKERYQDPIFDGVPVNERPFSFTCVDRWGAENLDSQISKLRQWRSAFVSAKMSKELVGTGGDLRVKMKKKSKKSKPTSLTKKESKRRGSNWEKLKTSMKG